MHKLAFTVQRGEVRPLVKVFLYQESAVGRIIGIKLFKFFIKFRNRFIFEFTYCLGHELN